jgi:outer membrane lipopolysaccharide assembly protein LptE/RlpB
VRMSRISLLSLLLPAVFSLGGCGYRLTSNPDLASPVSGKKIAVPVFANKSSRANVGAILTGSLVDEFARRSGGKVTSEKSAELILTGTVLSYSSTTVSYSAADKVREYKSLITVEATMTEKETSKVVWKGVISWDQTYPVNTNIAVRNSSIVFQNSTSTMLPSNIALQQNNEEAAIREICARLAQQIYQRVATGF